MHTKQFRINFHLLRELCKCYRLAALGKKFKQAYIISYAGYVGLQRLVVSQGAC